MQARETVNPHCQEAEGFSLSVLTPDLPTNSPNEAFFESRQFFMECKLAAPFSKQGSWRHIHTDATILKYTGS
jgi:hypothetical protein